MTIIKDILKARGMSQNSLGQRARIPQGSLSMICNDKLYPCPAWRRRISEVIGTPEYVLFPRKTVSHEVTNSE
jgi:transcriptional regulator with XRE-family HTH domain